MPPSRRLGPMDMEHLSPGLRLTFMMHFKAVSPEVDPVIAGLVARIHEGLHVARHEVPEAALAEVEAKLAVAKEQAAKMPRQVKTARPPAR